MHDVPLNETCDLPCLDGEGAGKGWKRVGEGCESMNSLSVELGIQDKNKEKEEGPRVKSSQRGKREKCKKRRKAELNNKSTEKRFGDHKGGK